VRVRFRPGIGFQIAATALVSSSVAIAILAVGVWVVGGQTFAELMRSHGQDAAEAHEMFDQALLGVLVLAMLVAVGAATVLAAIIGGRLARPLRDIGAAARQIAEGDYQARLPQRGPEELLSLTDSFDQMAAALEEQERMRREFIANAAHELRTPLTNLQGYLEALRDGVVEPERETFMSLWEEADRLVRLSRSLDQLAAGDAGTQDHHPEELDLREIVRMALDLVRPAARAASLEIEADLPRPIAVTADPDRIAQVLSNLLNNAIRYTPAGGRVSVRAERRPDDVLVSIVNTGSSIPADDLPHIFERFYRVEKSRDRARGGAGIGLSIVQQLVEAAGGRVGADSSGGLTRFWFTLPV
jgi:two-component system, OmpR family, sensor histidine kinase BaeS